MHRGFVLFRFCLVCVLGWHFVAAPIVALARQSAPKNRAEQPEAWYVPIVARLAFEIDESLDTKSPDTDRAVERAESLFDWVAAYADPAREPETFRLVARTRRLARHADSAEGIANRVIHVTRSAPDFATRLAFHIPNRISNSDRIGITRVMLSLYDRLGTRGTKVFQEFPDLAASICVMHRMPLVAKINENSATAASPDDLFEHFVSLEGHTPWSLREMPAELLDYVVNTSLPIEDLRWAHEQYKKHAKPESLYFNIDYDYEHYSEGKKKKLTAAGFSYRNILRYGGICADQAYFAAETCRALGIPATRVYGRFGDTAHAWVGVMRVEKEKPVWDFETGRYSEYQSVRGIVMDRGSMAGEADGLLEFASESTVIPASEREQAVAITDAAIRIFEHSQESPDQPFAPVIKELDRAGDLPEPRRATPEQSLTMLRSALDKRPSCLPAWTFFMSVAKQPGTMTNEDKDRWLEAVQLLCGRKYPDFTWSVTEAMINSIPDAAHRARAYDAVERHYRKRPDISCEILYGKAGSLLREDQPEKAYETYKQIVLRHTSDSPLSVAAYDSCEAIYKSRIEELRKSGNVQAAERAEKQSANELVTILSQATRRVDPPNRAKNIEQLKTTNWYKFHIRYVTALTNAGKHDQAASTRDLIKSYTQRVRAK